MSDATAPDIFLQPIPDWRLKELWTTYGPQHDEDPVIRNLHEWDFLMLLVEVARGRGVALHPRDRTCPYWHRCPHCRACRGMGDDEGREDG